MRNSLPDEDVPELAVTFDAARLLQISGAAVMGIALGIAVGLLIAWVIAPVEYFNADPIDLRQRHKDDYVRMIGAAYVSDGNLAKAKQRLVQLGANFTAASFRDRLIQEQKAGRDPATLDALALLAQGMGFGAMPVPARTPSAETNAANKPVLPIPRFQLAERTAVTCTDELNQGRLQFNVRDARGNDAPNIAIEIRWANGDDIVYTGLKPERGAGYADWDAAPGNYSVTIVNAQSETADELRIGEPPANCRNDRGNTPRGWKIVFQQK